MSDAIQHIDLDDEDFSDAPRALREYARSLKSKLASVEKERDQFRGRATSAALGDVLKVYKNPDRVKRDLLSDGVDPLDSSAVDKWLSDNGSDYAQGEGAPSSEQPEPVAHEDAAAHQQIQDGSALRSPADMSALEAAMAEMPENASGADFVALARKHGL